MKGSMTLDEAKERIAELEEELSDLQDKLSEVEDDRNTYEHMIKDIRSIL